MTDGAACGKPTADNTDNNIKLVFSLGKNQRLPGNNLQVSARISSSERSFTVTTPSPGTSQTRAIELFLLPVP